MTPAVVVRSLSLAPEPVSASLARRLVRSALRDGGAEHWLDAAELAVSELVTNAVLHAHTALDVTISCGPDDVRVEVVDRNPTLPVQRAYGEQATTGRGMSLLASITTSHGVTPLPGGGKTVWFVLRDVPPLPAAPGPGRAGAASNAAPTSAEPSRITLAGLPPHLWLAAGQHHDGLLRELALYRHGRGESVGDLAVADRARFCIRSALDAELGPAAGAGPAAVSGGSGGLPERLDLVVEVGGAQAARDFGTLQDVLDEAERLARDGRFLARPALPEIVALRDWAAESVIAQLAGEPPSPWSGTVEDDADAAVEVTAAGGEVSAVSGPSGAALAADDANRILAVNPSFAALVGWQVADLVGRRIVAIVPARFREAHVAGFTRYLATGQSHILGQPVALPVLRADGAEILCRVLIEPSRSVTGRSTYLAWVTPESDSL